MKKTKQQFISSWQALAKPQTLATTAMLIALGVILSFFATIPITQSQRISFSSLANELIALLFGPVVGSLSAGVGDIVKFFLRPTGGAFYPGFTVSALVAGLLYGVILYKRPLTFLRVLFANIAVTVVVNMTLNNIWLARLYGSNTFFGHLITRAPLQLVMIAVDAILFFGIAKALKKARVFAALEE